MSMIKKALEKAKAERGEQETIVDPTKRPAGPREQAGKIDRVNVPSEKLEGGRASVYSQTKVINPSITRMVENKIVVMDEDNPICDRFKLLRTRIFHLTRAKGWNTILVTSCGIDEGKSLVSTNLAVSMAHDVRQTSLLVDLDFRRPTVSRLLDLGTHFLGLESYFLEGLPLDEILINPGIENMTVLPSAGNVKNVPELMGSPKMEALILELKERYKDRYIIIDSPAINVCPDPLVILEYVDAVLLVARANQTALDSIDAAMELIPKEKILGFVLNDAIEDEVSGYYNYGYGR